MNLIMKLAGLWIALGFCFGLVAKTQLKGPYRIVPLVLSLAPLMAHLGYSYTEATNLLTNESQLALYLGSSIILLGIVFWVGWQSLQRRGASLMLLPIVMAVIYTFGPLTWLINASEELNLWVNSMPTLLFFAGTLFVSSLLFAFQLTLPKLPKLPERKEVPEEDQKRKVRRSKPKAAKAKPTKPARTKAARTKTPAPTLRNARVRPNAKNQRRSSKRP